jgi:uncharacterized membrane protein (UPF0127 family)
LIPECAWVHTIGMRFSLDVAFVSWPPGAGRLEVVRVAEHLRPFRSARHAGARAALAALELADGHARKLGIAEGASLELV